MLALAIGERSLDGKLRTALAGLAVCLAMSEASAATDAYGAIPSDSAASVRRWRQPGLGPVCFWGLATGHLSQLALGGVLSLHSGSEIMFPAESLPER